MKKIITLIAILAVSLSLSAQGKPEGLFINSKAPDFKVKDQSGMEVSLKELRKKGPVVLMFYRGNWCPYCNRHLAKMQDSLQLIAEKGATLVAITPEQAEGVAQTIDKTKAVYSILSDTEMKIAKAYKVDYAVDDRTVNRYKNAGIDLLQTNGQKGKAMLPVPAVYIINKDGAITYRFFEEDYKKRPSVRELLAEIK
jgi:peroxiredoxin